MGKVKTQQVILFFLNIIGSKLFYRNVSSVGKPEHKQANISNPHCSEANRLWWSRSWIWYHWT